MVLEVRMKPKGPFHIGERGIGYEGAMDFIPADTIFASICANWAMMFGENEMVTDLLADGRPDWTPPFLLSSAFPFAGSVKFYRKPLLPSPEEGKQWKKIEWVSEAVFERWLKGEEIDSERLLPIHGGKVILTLDECERLSEDLGVRSVETLQLWSIQRTPRVTLDIMTRASSLFHFGRLIFRDGCGLFFFVRFLKKDLSEKFLATVRLMGDEGVGGDRTVGHGAFEPEFTENTPKFCQPRPSDMFITLSPLFPKPDEVSSLLSDGCRYSFTVRSGWVGGVFATTLRRKTVRMLSEGSVLCGSAEKVWGTMADVTPQNSPHPVYRWGFAFPIPCEVSQR